MANNIIAQITQMRQLTAQFSSGFNAQAGYGLVKNGDTISVRDDALRTNYARDILINGNFQVWQRGTSFSNPSSTSSAYTADRWQCFRSSFATGLSITQQTAEISSGGYAIRVQRTAGNAATNGITLGQSVETLNATRFRNTYLTLQFAAKVGANFSASAVTVTIGASTLTDAGPTTSAGTALGTTTITAATTSKTRYTVTTSTPVPANTNTLMVNFTYTPTGTAGVNDWFEIEEVSLQDSAVALPICYRSYPEELTLCMRYYQKAGAGCVGRWISATQCELFCSFPVHMRTTPTVTLNTTTPVITESGIGARTGTASAIFSSTFTTFMGIGRAINGFTGAAAGGTAASNSSYFDCFAELF